MKIWIVLLSLISLSSGWNFVNAQCSGRYYDEVFSGPTFTTVIPGLGQIPDISKLGDFSVVFGSAEGQTLDMYVFPPEGDDPGSTYYEEKRPLIILAFGGSFTAGFRESPDIINLCQAFTKRGYVTASIKYRLNTGTIDSATMLKQVVKAVQDAKAAVRFFYKDASTTDTYRIDTNKIFMGGTSAGALVGLHLGYLTDTLRVQKWMKEIIATQGDLEGISGNPGYSSKVAGIINLAGAIGDTSWIGPDGPPMVSMQGNDDGTVPYCTDIISVSGNELLEVDGCATIKRRTAHLGIVNRFYTWKNAGHVPYVDPRPTTVGPAYMDTTIWFIRDFLFEQVSGIRCDSALWARGNVTQPEVFQGNTLVSCGSKIVDPTDDMPFNGLTGILSFNTDRNFSIYPNPSYDLAYVDKPSEFTGSVEVNIYNTIGKLVHKYANITSRLTLKKAEIGTGIFIVTMTDEDNASNIARQKVVFQ